MNINDKVFRTPLTLAEIVYGMSEYGILLATGALSVLLVAQFLLT
jgi:hypothetical protein